MIFFLFFILKFSFLFSIDYTTSTIAGTGIEGTTNGPGLSSTFSHPFGCAISPDNSYGLVADSRNGALRKLTISASLQTSTVSLLTSIPNIFSLCFVNSNIIFVSTIGSVLKIDLTTLTSTFIASAIDLAAMSCSHDGKSLLITSYTGDPGNTLRPLYLLDTSINRRVNLTKFTSLPSDSLGITFSPDDTFALATSVTNSLYKIIISTGIVTTLVLPRTLQVPIGISYMNGEYLIVEGSRGITRYNYNTNILSPSISLTDSYSICSSSDATSYSLITLYQVNKVAILTPTVSVPTLAPTTVPLAHTYTYSVLAGSGTAGSRDDIGIAATLNQPWGCAISLDNTYGLIADTGNSLIRRYNFKTGQVTTVLSNLRAGFIVMHPTTNTIAYFTSNVGVHSFDLTTLTSTLILSLTSLGPIAISSDAKFLIVGSYKGTNLDTSPRTFYKITLATYTQESLFTVPFDSLGIVITNNNLFAYISALYAGEIYRIDLTTKTSTKLTLSRVLSGPTGISLVEFGSYLLITEYLGSGITRLNFATNELKSIVTVSQANAICMSSDSTIGLVSLLNANKISGLLSDTPVIFTTSPTLVPTLAPTQQTASPTIQYVQRPAHNYTFSIIAGSGTAGSRDDIGIAATFNQPWGCAISLDNTYGLIADTSNNKIRKININNGIVQTLLNNTQIGFISIYSNEIAYFTSNIGFHKLDLTTLTSTLIASATTLGAIATSSNGNFLLATTHKGVTGDTSPHPFYKLTLNGANYELESILTVPFDSLGVTITNNNLFAYISALYEGSIYRIDLTTKTSTKLTLSRVLSGPTGISLVEFGSYLLITEYLGSGITRLNFATNELKSIVTVSQANAICMSSDSTIGLVSLLNANKIGYLQRDGTNDVLQPGQCCRPNKIDHYCSYNGKCDPTGSFCICTDPIHYSPSDRCMNYYSSNTLPDICPALQFPYIPTQQPTKFPTSIPTKVPSPVVCTPNDRNYCSNAGYCNAQGNQCICDDSIHFWPSEKCSIRHNGPELNPGQVCTPNSIDIYCNYLGTCNSDGTACICTDSLHRLPSERCAIWHPITTGVCVPYDRKYCNNHGSCSANGDGCVCDDNQHYWASELCSRYRTGPQLDSSTQCCKPNSVDTYCNYLGKCNSNGTKCICFDSNHRLSSERCLNYYNTLTPDQIAENNLPNLYEPGNCPQFLSETDSYQNNNNNGNDNKTKQNQIISIVFIVIGVLLGLVLTGMIVVFLANRHRQVQKATELRPTANVSMSWYEDNPIKQVRLSLSSGTSDGSRSVPRRQSSLNPFTKKSDSYVEITEDIHLPSEILEEQNSYAIQTLDDENITKDNQVY